MTIILPSTKPTETQQYCKEKKALEYSTCELQLHHQTIRCMTSALRTSP